MTKAPRQGACPPCQTRRSKPRQRRSRLSRRDMTVLRQLDVPAGVSFADECPRSGSPCHADPQPAADADDGRPAGGAAQARRVEGPYVDRSREVPRPAHGSDDHRARGPALPDRPPSSRARAARGGGRERVRHGGGRSQPPAGGSFLEHDELQGLDSSIRRQRGQASLRRPSQDGRRHGGRPLSLARRRAARERRLRQGFDAVRRIPVGGLLSAANQGQVDQVGFRRSRGRGADRWRRAARPTTCRAGVAPTPTRPPPPRKAAKKKRKTVEPPEIDPGRGRLRAARRENSGSPGRSGGRAGHPEFPQASRGASGRLMQIPAPETFGVSVVFLGGFSSLAVEAVAGDAGCGRSRFFWPDAASNPPQAMPRSRRSAPLRPRVRQPPVRQPDVKGRAPRRGPAGRRQRGFVRPSRRRRPPRW